MSRSPGRVKPEGVTDEDTPYSRPGQLSSVPQTKTPDEGGADDQPQDWARYPGGVKPEGVDDEDSPFDRPGDVRSIPRDGKPPNEDSPESDWNRHPNDRVLGAPVEEIPFDKTGQPNSIPRTPPLIHI